MCGIAVGISSRENVFLKDIVSMTEKVSHRGPNGSNFASVSGSGVHQSQEESSAPAQIALGHARLAVLDTTSASNQPMFAEDKSLAIVFNGEIYNYVELRNELTQLGFHFSSSGDVEVLLAAYRAWGLEALRRLRGMFSFVLVDLKHKKAIAVRDRFGIKPLYYWKDSDCNIYFASEIKQFTSLPTWKAQINNLSALQFLLHGSTNHSKFTMFADVKQVNPGNYLEIRFDNELLTREIEWWTHSASEFAGDYNEAMQEFKNLFFDSMTLHLRSDVPIGSCLSGGIDSSAIVSTAQHCVNTGNLTHLTFTAGSEVSELDETRFAELVAKRAGAIEHYVRPNFSGLWENLDSITWHQDEPFGSTSVYAQWCVFKEASKHVTVMLDGQGADEYLAGYDAFINLNIADLLMHLKLRRAFKEWTLFEQRGRTSLYSVISSLAFSRLPANWTPWIGHLAGLPAYNADGWLNASLVRDSGVSHPSNSMYGRPAKNVKELTQLSLVNMQSLLRYEDRNSMAHGIESRVPFLDHKLVEFATSLPSSFLISNGKTKKVLTDSLSDYIPNEIVSRKDKIGFQAAEGQWLRSNPQLIRAELLDAIDLSNGVLTSNLVTRWDSISSGNMEYSSEIWRAISFGRWLKSFNVSV
jgi:asparagine synthase (glutamine-hydrolysing)